jgi:uncharacterized protein YukE
LADCTGAVFNIYVDFQDDGEKARFIATLNAQGSRSGTIEKKLLAINAKVESMKLLMVSKGDNVDELKRSVAKMEEQRRTDGLFSSEMSQKYDALVARMTTLEEEQIQLQRTYEGRSVLAFQTIDYLKSSSESDHHSVEQLSREVTSIKARQAKIDERAGAIYNATKDRLSIVLRYGVEKPFKQKGSADLDIQSFGMHLGYLTPGTWFLSPGIGFFELRGTGVAVVTDPRGVELGRTSSWRSRAYLATADLSFGRDFGATWLYARVGIRNNLFATYSTEEFGEVRNDTTGTSYPFALGITLRPIAGAVLQVEVGAIYWKDAQPSRYVYQGPTGAASLAGSEARLDIVLATGLGYVFTL